LKRNKFAIISVIILGAIAWWLYTNKGKGTIDKSIRDFSIMDVTTVDKIILKRGNAVINLARQDVGRWQLDKNYTANGNCIKSLLYTIKNIDIKEPVAKSIQDSILKDLGINGVKCEIYQNNVLSKTYCVGNETADGSGTYVVLIDKGTMEPAAKAFVAYITGVEGNVAANYFVDEKAWRDNTVFSYKPEDIQSVKLEVPLYPQASYELSINSFGNQEVKMLVSKQSMSNIDTSSVKQYLSYFEQLSFESFESDLNVEQKASLIKSTPLNILTVTDRNGRTNKVQFYPIKNTKNEVDEQGKSLKFDPEHMFALLNNGKDLVFVKFYEFGKVMPPVDYFQRKSK
jgi:Domain of unknown function (DUF4340)